MGINDETPERTQEQSSHDALVALRRDLHWLMPVRIFFDPSDSNAWDELREKLRALAGGPDGVLPSAAEAPPATSDIGAYEAGVRYEHERIERLIMGHDPIEPSDRAYLLKLIKRAEAERDYPLVYEMGATEDE